jgi:hypothetical protein
MTRPGDDPSCPLSPEELRRGDVLLCPLRRGAGVSPLAGCFDALVADLDGSPFSHAAIVVQEHPESVLVVDSSHRSAFRTVDDLLQKYGGPIVVRRPTARGKVTATDVGATAAAAAAMMATQHRTYPLEDALLAALALRLRRSSGDWSERRRNLTELEAVVERLRPGGRRRGWMCAALVGEAYRRTGSFALERARRSLPPRTDLSACAESLAPFLQQALPALGVGDGAAIIDLLLRTDDAPTAELTLSRRAPWVRRMWRFVRTGTAAARARPDTRRTTFLTPGDLDATPDLITIGRLSPPPSP